VQRFVSSNIKKGSDMAIKTIDEMWAELETLALDMPTPNTYMCLVERGTVTKEWAAVAMALTLALVLKDTQADLITARQKEAVGYKCYSCGEPLSVDCPKCKRLWQS
jgi:hypothetical protein